MKNVFILIIAFLIGAMPMMAQTQSAPKLERKWVDLGLSSGTLWAAQPEEGYYTYDEAREAFGGQIPSEWQWDELIKSCYIEKTYGKPSLLKLTGKNGNTLIIKSMGMMDAKSKPHDLDKFAFWTFNTAHYDSKYAYVFGNLIEVSQTLKSYRYAVLLVNK